ncbi:AMP-binding protein [Oryzibacter oryziterrae]|uniref:AMP-binding protein n=1 Tax=Oryzibacter oryziterrae TaxID=2766474 RepID=UPI001F473700|nr:AMP-binding protein [Oryzibacter oryziterrae]
MADNLQKWTAFDDYRKAFRWSLGERLNMGVDVADAWAVRDPDRVAIITHADDGRHGLTSFRELALTSNRLCNTLAALGLGVGDRVAILLPQTVEAVTTHVAAYKGGLVALPLSILFGADALEYRLRRAEVKAVVTTVAGAERIEPLRSGLPALARVITTDGVGPSSLGWTALIEAASDAFTPVGSGPLDPALMIFTSGTTGNPKPALHGQSVLAGHLPGINLAQDMLGRPGDLMWTPADWAWAGGLLNALLPALHAGVPVLAHRFDKFDPDLALKLMATHRVTNSFLPPTALKLMRQLGDIRGRHPLALRAIGSAGEALGREAYDWAAEAFGFPVNEFYGQTECNAVIGSAHALGCGRAGATGKAIPGHVVAIIDEAGKEVPPGTAGEIAVARPDPVMFLGYAGDPEATAAKFKGDWMTTGDTAMMDEDGYFHFIGRDDDVITSSGYRIGPGEIEDCLMSHPAVRLAVAVGKPDPIRTEIVKGFVVLNEGQVPSDVLRQEIQLHVRSRLSAHEYPRELDFVDHIPITTSGKLIRRHFRDNS